MRAKLDDSFDGVQVHVIGLGSYGTGRAIARALFQRGAKVTVSDIKPAGELTTEIERLKDTGVTILTGGDAYRGIEEAELVVPSPGVPLGIPPLLRAREHGAKIVSDIEIAFLIAPCPIIAITGTKGKTTTAALLGELLKDAGKHALVGGNIGIPLVELAEVALPDDLLVAEVSSFQLEAVKVFRPWVAVLLNVFADHLDRHETMAAYREAKARIFANQEPDDTAILNRDDPGAWEMRGIIRARALPFSIRQAEPAGADVADGWLRVRGQPVCPVTAVRLRGRHNLSNVLAALAAARAAGAGLERAAETLSRFTGIEHRLETAGTVRGVLFVNDSQATTPLATLAALESFEGRVILIAGGRSKGDGFGELAQAAARRGASLVLIGEAAEDIAMAAQAAGVHHIARAAALPEAVRLAFAQAKPGEVVLLSPACASFDMFKSMAERGRIFKETVRALSEQEGEQ